MPPPAPMAPKKPELVVGDREEEAEVVEVEVAVEEAVAVAVADAENVCPGFAFPSTPAPTRKTLVVGDPVDTLVGVEGRERMGGAVFVLTEDPVPPPKSLEIEGESERDTVGFGEALMEGEAVPLLDPMALLEGVGDPVVNGWVGVMAVVDVEKLEEVGAGDREDCPVSEAPTDNVAAIEGSEVGVHLSAVGVKVEVGDTLDVSEGRMVREERDQAPRVTVGVPSLSGVGVESSGEEGVSVGDSSDEGEPPSNAPVVGVASMDPRGLKEGTHWVPVAPAASLPLGVELGKAREEMVGALIPLLTPLAVGGDKEPVA